ncbi:MFS transporter [Streptomyces sp. NPDC087270]|uniref:MFS transporter n=1 Tax=Streptomyces sp. NPDC087270 TaxID=3365774 RepID=UPI0037FF14EE
MATGEAQREKPAVESLRGQSDFLRLWTGQSISTLGSSISSVALPLVAVVTLGASTMQISVLTFLQTLPALPLSLFVGVLVDRVSPLRLLIVSDLGRGVAVGAIPVLAYAGLLRVEVMYVCMFVIGVLSTVFDISYGAYLPRLLPQSLLIAANSRMELTRNVLSLTGKGVAGAAIAVMRIPFVVAADALSYFCSALSLVLIRRRSADPSGSPSPARPAPRQVIREIREGVTAVFGNRYLRPVTVNAALSNFLTQVVLTLFVLYATRDLGLSGGWIGLVFAGGSVGGVVSSLLLPRLVERFGYGRAFLGFMVCLRAGLLCVGLVHGPQPLLIAGLTVLWFVSLLGLVGSNICLAALRQVAVPDELRGRANAAIITLIAGVTPLGAILAGVLGSAIGAHRTILGVTLLMPLPLLLVVFSPIRRLVSVTETAPQRS